MKEFQLILEDYLTESATIQMYHGGNLELTPRDTLHPDMFDKVPASKRQEYGPGLYLTTSEKVVEKYAKGSRKLYKITLKRGRDISDDEYDSLNKMSKEYNETRNEWVLNKLKDSLEKMGFNKRILPDKNTLQNMVYDFGIEEVVKRYNKTDMIMGDVESMAYLQNIIREYELE